MSILQISTALFLLISLAAFSFSFQKVLRIILAGAPSKVFDRWPQRFWRAFVEVLLHRKMMRQFWPGFLHLLIFWGFIILSLGTLEWIYYGLSGGLKFSFLGDRIYSGYVASQDFFNTFVFLAVLGAFYRRLFVKPKRMADNSSKSRLDAYFILFLILGLVISNLFCHAIEIHNKGRWETFADSQPSANLIASFLSTGSIPDSIYFSLWWLHLIIVFGFLNYLPYSKHFHVILAFPNVLLSKLEARGKLSTPNLEDESILSFGAEKLEDLKWKSILDSFACTECGRCNEFCPTASTGKALKPKTLMIDLRAAATGRAQNFAQLKDQALVPETFSDQFIWDCTTCGACVEACPVMIDHVDDIVEMRRALVLNRGSNPDEATNAFRNWESSSNPWGLSPDSRQEWLLNKGVPVFETGGDFEYLYYVGCAGSFDDRNKKVVDALVKILQAAKVKFGILGKEEKCNGETARRMGNEWLAQQMMRTNIELLNGRGAKKIITSCPHCFNTLANEYPSLGGNYEVIHHTQLIKDLINSGRLSLNSKSQEAITFHDSCYIGRYNQIFDEPRAAIAAVSKDEPIELTRSKEQGFCCGAGGGRMWLEENTGTRINENRAQEIVNSSAKSVGVACPFCMTMISDGLRSLKREDIAVKDVAELVVESLKS
ncbi:MAG: Fe-S oxidoreductase [Deltaproteobacteria bacterium CG11_big_fil_rev_8_21_14_0_20_45_16]|nr:MAG: Fe-S oxidoreductase [Deltaproteobacteria bacterium CG11_big_fil_rev_8_21_14_0_20_45_16]